MRLPVVMLLAVSATWSRAQGPSVLPARPASAQTKTTSPARTTPSASEARSYSALLLQDAQTWCAYNSPSDFQSKVATAQPTESARVSFTANKLTELTYQTSAESGDWILVDKYTVRGGGVVLRRANLLAQENLQVIQESYIREGKVGPFRLVRVSTLDGRKAELSPEVDLPEVAAQTDLLNSPPVQVAVELRSTGVKSICKKVN